MSLLPLLIGSTQIRFPGQSRPFPSPTECPTLVSYHEVLLQRDPRVHGRNGGHSVEKPKRHCLHFFGHQALNFALKTHTRESVCSRCHSDTAKLNMFALPEHMSKELNMRPNSFTVLIPIFQQVETNSSETRSQSVKTKQHHTQLHASCLQSAHKFFTELSCT